MNSIYSSINYRLGQVFVDNKNTYRKYHDYYNSLFISIITTLMSITYILILPFVKLYSSGIKDVNYIYPSIPLFFCLIQLLSWSRYVSGNLSGIAGFAKQTSYVSLIEAGLNIIMSISLVRKYGITGVLFATVIALPLKVIYTNWLAEKKILKRSPKRTVFMLILNYLVFFLTVIVVNHVEVFINSIFEFALWGFFLSLFYCFIAVIINLLINQELYKNLKDVLSIKK